MVLLILLVLFRALVDERPDVGIVDVRLPPSRTRRASSASLTWRRRESPWDWRSDENRT